MLQHLGKFNTKLENIEDIITVELEVEDHEKRN
jgi:hypothetical protein